MVSDRTAVKPFVRAQMPVRLTFSTYDHFGKHMCHACKQSHPRGACPLKVAGVEHCGLCGLAHFGYGRTCPHIRSETQVRDMLQALKSSPEKKELVDAAVKYLRGVKGTLVQQKKKDKEKAMIKTGQLNSHPGSHYGQGGTNSPRLGPIPDHFQGPPPPRHEVPPTYNGAAATVPTGPSNYLMTSRGPQPHQQQQWSQHPYHIPAVHPALIEDHAVESALRGFLGQ